MPDRLQLQQATAGVDLDLSVIFLGALKAYFSCFIFVVLFTEIQDLVKVRQKVRGQKKDPSNAWRALAGVDLAFQVKHRLGL